MNLRRNGGRKPGTDGMFSPAVWFMKGRWASLPGTGDRNAGTAKDLPVAGRTRPYTWIWRFRAAGDGGRLG